jgi:hypothetical protein
VTHNSDVDFVNWFVSDMGFNVLSHHVQFLLE